jgi:hypothetical protein
MAQNIRTNLYGRLQQVSQSPRVVEATQRFGRGEVPQDTSSNQVVVPSPVRQSPTQGHLKGHLKAYLWVHLRMRCRYLRPSIWIARDYGTQDL